MKNTYPEVNNNISFSAMENKILSYWQANKIFEYSVDGISYKGNFVFYDGPPFANGLPHYGHLLTGYVKDSVARFQTMLGSKVERRFGWDCHGLPAELYAEKELGISGRNDIIAMGVDKFNNTCKTSVLKFTNEWQEYVTRQGRWVDFKNEYKTMDITFMESVLWAFKELYKKGLVYRSHRVMPYSWACETPLSNFETKLDNSYRERADKSVTVRFKLLDKANTYILAWTTTPWTLPSNLALAVNPDMNYAMIEKDDEVFILAEFAVKKHSKEIGENILQTIKGTELLGLKYEPLMDYFADHENSFVILGGEFVTEGEGTGIVHMAPGFGEDDQILCEKNNIELVCPVDSQGKFTAEVRDFVGMNVFDANDEIIKLLKTKNRWIKTEQYLHNYPHCWRTDTPLIYKAVPSWYVEVTKFKDRMVELNQQINWIPSNIKDGQFGKWLENARDWSISRNRFWGTPIPIWESDNPEYPRIDVYGSIAELEKDFGVKIESLHKPFIDNLVRPNPDDPSGKTNMRRVPDVFDCWFESGSMPYGQAHYPFENKEYFEKNFPADFIVEYVAQTRGWFYTLMVLSTALFDRPPFKNAICHGVILASDGQKLSKRLKNYSDPLEIFAKYGSDALRFFVLSSQVLRGGELLIDKDAQMVKDSLRLTIKPLWNAYNFFTIYANADNIKAEESFNSSDSLDRYILAKLGDLAENTKASLQAYNIPEACLEINQFLDVLNNWYIRRNRSRFWKTEKDQDKINAYNTLYTVLVNFSKIAAPLLPFICEEIYVSLVHFGDFSKLNSVHLTSYPEIKKLEVGNLVEEMDIVKEICSGALFIRNEENLKIRLPLNALNIYANHLNFIDNYIDIIKDELNVKQINIFNNVDEIADYKLKINYRTVGKKFPQLVKQITEDLKLGKWQRSKDNLLIAGIELNKEEFELLLEPKEPKGKAVIYSGSIVLALDTIVTEELLTEGLARDLVREIQQIRKECNFHISDKIEIFISAEDDFQNKIKNYLSYISEQTLANISFSEREYQRRFEVEIDSYKLTILV